MSRLGRFGRRDDAQAWAAQLSTQSTRLIMLAEATLRSLEVIDVASAHAVEQIELCIAEASECEAMAQEILASGTPSLATWFAGVLEKMPL